MARNNNRKPKHNKTKPRNNVREPKQSEIALNLFSTVDPNFTVSSRNAKTYASNNNSIDFTILHAVIPPASLIDFSFIKDQVQEVINSFGVSRGYVSTVETTDVEEIVELSASALSHLLIAWRAFSSREVTTQDGIRLSPLMDLDFDPYAVATKDYFTISLENYQDLMTGVSGGNISTSILTLLGNVSNAQWAQQYLSRLGDVYTNTPIFSLMVQLYSGVFDLSSGGTTNWVQFHPRSYPAATAVSPLTRFEIAVDSIRTKLHAKPDLKPILELLGFNSYDAINFDWTRDIKGKSLLVFEDPAMMYIMNNDKLKHRFRSNLSTTSRLFSTFVDPMGPNDVFSYPEMAELQSSVIGFLIAIQSGDETGYLSHYTVLRDATSVAGMYKFFPYMPHAFVPTFNLAEPLVNPSTDAPFIANAMISNALTGKYQPATPTYNVLTGYMELGSDGETLSNVSGSPTVEQFEFGGPNTYRVPDAVLIRDIWRATLVAGPEYRVQLQNKLNALASTLFSRTL